jgi:coenzyme F420-0:L-glutamate ligase / coenzyme F420-1:gamma-L-glutamate ligase
MKTPTRLSLSVVPGIPLIAPGDDLGAVIVRAMDESGMRPVDGDIIVVAQKIVSKSQNRLVDLNAVTPSPRAKGIAAAIGKDPRLIEVILSESVRIVRQHPRALITEHRAGFISANAGVDRSNLDTPPGKDLVLLLPADCDGVAESLRASLRAHYGAQLGVIVSDSFGRPWRRGTVGVALGAAGISALNDLRGHPDLFGRRLEATETGFADEVASAASLLMGQANEANPIVLVSGFLVSDRHLPASALIRPACEDLFQ